MASEGTARLGAPTIPGHGDARPSCDAVQFYLLSQGYATNGDCVVQ